MDSYVNADKVRSAIVTGASQGIGKAIASRFADNGIRTVLAARSAERLESVKHALPSDSELVSCLPLDLAELSSIDKFAEDVRSRLSRLDILVNCAGVYSRGSWEDSTVQQFDQLYQTNVRGVYALTKALLPLLIEARGDVVFINSTVVFSDAENLSHFSATQHSLQALANALRSEVNRHGVRVLSVYPGRTATPRQESIHSQEKKDYFPECLLQPSDVAEIVTACVNLPETAEVMDLRIRPRNK